MVQEQPSQTLRTTALVHKLYLTGSWTWTRSMGRIGSISMGLIEREEAAPDSVVVGCEILLLDEALKQMGTLDARNAEVVALRYFGGLSVEETATPLGVSEETMMRDWKLAKTRLLRDSTTRRVHDG